MRVLLTTLLLAGFISGCARESEPPLASAERSFRAGNFTAAVQEADQHLILFPDDLAALMLRGKIKTAAEDYAGAIEDFSRAVELTPNDPEPYYNREIAYRRLGNRELAKADAKRGRELDPLYERAYAFENLSTNRPRPRTSNREDSTNGSSSTEAAPDGDSMPAERVAEVEPDDDWNESGGALASEEDREYADMLRQQRSNLVQRRMIETDQRAAAKRPEHSRPAAKPSAPAVAAPKQRDSVALGGPPQNAPKGTANEPESTKPVLSTALPREYAPGGAPAPTTGLRVGGTSPWLNRYPPPINDNGTANAANPLPSRAGPRSPFNFRPGPVLPNTLGGKTSPPSLSTSLDVRGVTPQGYDSPVPTTGTPNQRPTGRSTVLPPPITTTLPNR